MARKGMLLVYTGDGKGKTTASLGVILRAIGRGMTVKYFQFIKLFSYAFFITKLSGVTISGTTIAVKIASTKPFMPNAIIKIKINGVPEL